MPTRKKTTYQTVRSTITNKINAYKCLYGQTSGGVTKHRPTPTQLNSFSKWIDKGAVVHNVTAIQLNRWSGVKKNWTSSTAKTWLSSNYGKTCIKAVVNNKNGGFLVATTAQYKNKPFKFRTMTTK